MTEFEAEDVAGLFPETAEESMLSKYLKLRKDGNAAGCSCKVCIPLRKSMSDAKLWRHLYTDELGTDE